MVLAPGFIVLLLASVAGLVVASATPASLLGGETVDLTVSAHVEWHPVLSKWTIDAPLVSASESKILNFGALFRNALSFTSGSQPARFTLETASGQVLDTVEQATGKGGLFNNERTLTVVFRHVDPGDYVVRVVIYGDGGETVAEQARSVRLTPEAAS